MPSAPSCLVGLFCSCSKIPGPGEIRERSRMSALQKRLLGRRRSLAFLHGVGACSGHFSDLFGIPSLSGSYRRNRPHGSGSPAGQPYRVARAEFDGNRLRAWAAGSSRRRYRILRLPCGCAEKDQSGGRNQSKLGADCELASGHRSRDQSFQSSRNCTIARKPGNFFLRYRSSYRRGNHLLFKKTLRCAWCSRGRRNTRRRIEAPACQSATTNWRSTAEALATLPGWSIVEAVSKRRIAVISDAVNRPAPRIVSAIEDLAKQLHPDAFTEKSESNKEKIEKDNPAPNHRPTNHSSVSPGGLRARMPISGGCACVR